MTSRGRKPSCKLASVHEFDSGPQKIQTKNEKKRRDAAFGVAAQRSTHPSDTVYSNAKMDGVFTQMRI